MKVQASRKSRKDKNLKHQELFKKYGFSIPSEKEITASFGSLKDLHLDAKKLRAGAWKRSA